MRIIAACYVATPNLLVRLVSAVFAAVDDLRVSTGPRQPASLQADLAPRDPAQPAGLVELLPVERTGELRLCWPPPLEVAGPVRAGVCLRPDHRVDVNAPVRPLPTSRWRRIGPIRCACTTTVPHSRSEQALRPKKTILCVDDNEQVLSVRTFLLETRGYRVITAHTAQQALEYLENSIPGSVDLLLCDLLMPQMDGNELVRRAKQIHPGLPAMIVSGTVNAFDRAICADVFLPKGASSPAEMIERIRVLVARKRGPRKAPAPQSVTVDLAVAIAS